VICSLLLVGGCGGGSGVGAVKATGTVTLDGTPVEGATVTFVPKGEGRVATGITDAEGKFAMKTVEAGDGAVPGSYDVIVSKLAVVSGSAAASQEEEMARLEDMSKKGELRAVQTPTANQLPNKYSVKGQSGLTAEVAEGSDNDFVFALTSS
jgi:hypothetical protein